MPRLLNGILLSGTPCVCGSCHLESTTGELMANSSLLLIGGTQFVGRALLEEALASGWNVTAFHRGKTGAGLLADDPRVTHILGDRDADLSPLADGQWDAVVDCIGYFPEPVRKTAEFLKNRVGRYAFISTISVYQPSNDLYLESESPLMNLPEGADVSKVTGETYGALKVQCEEALNEVLGGEVLHIRAGLQIGPNDHTDRFSDWVERIGRRSRVIVPESSDQDWQLIDARDTARFTLHGLKTGLTGAYNTTGEITPMLSVLEGVRSIVNPSCEFIRLSDSDLEAKGIAPWTDLALWIPTAGRDGNRLIADISKARAAGLTFTPLEVSAKEIWASVKGLPLDRQRRAGLSSAREDEILG